MRTVLERVTVSSRALLGLVTLVLALVLPREGLCQQAREVPAPRSDEWLEAVGRIPVLESGRVKPLDTVARYGLLFLARSGSYKGEVGGKTKTVGALEWYAAMLADPASVADARVFRIDDTTVLETFGIDLEEVSRRDLLAWSDLRQSYDPIIDQAIQAGERQQSTGAKATPTERAVERIARQLKAWRDTSAAMGFARWRAALPSDDSAAAGKLRELFPAGTQQVDFGQVLRVFPALLQLRQAEPRAADGQGSSGPASDLVASLEGVLRGGDVLQLFPVDGDPLPESASAADRQAFHGWRTPTELAQAAARGQVTERMLDAAASLCTAFAPGQDDATAVAALQRYLVILQQVAGRRGESELRSLQSEITYHDAALMKWSWGLGWMGVVVGLLALLFGKRVWPYRLAWAVGLTVCSLLVGVIGWRCYIVARPPVGTLYETIPFITLCMVAMGLFIERLNRRRTALVGALLLGALGSHLAVEFETLEAQDTFRELQAVLLSDYWLIVHVLTINLGYAASLFAALLGSHYIFQRLRGVRFRDPVAVKENARMVYGAVCFGLVTVSVGTILGGVWANDSWGRFWGWDPKENGAALIAIAQIIILHGRMGGHVKDLGIAVMAALTGIVVVFSWFHVNLLEVGLHSYGHSDAVKLGVMWGYYGIQGGIAALGWLVPMAERAAQARLARDAWSGAAVPADSAPA